MARDASSIFILSTKGNCIEMTKQEGRVGSALKNDNVCLRNGEKMPVNSWGETADLLAVPKSNKKPKI